MRPRLSRRQALAGAAGALSALVLTACTSRGTRPSPAPSRSRSPLPRVDGDARAALSRAGAATRLELPAGSLRFVDFADSGDSTYTGLDVPGRFRAVAGAGRSRTVLEMRPGTSTRASLIPTTFPDTNQLSLVRVNAGTVDVGGFTVRGTQQGHLYNGIRVSQTVDLRMHDVLIQHIPGSSSSPPGETFGINDYRTTGTRYIAVEVDGEGVGAAGIGVNDSSGTSLQGCTVRRNPFSAGVTFYQSTDVTVEDCDIRENGVTGVNIERASGSVALLRNRTGANRHGDLRVASDRASVVVQVIDPVLTAGRFVVVLPPTYAGAVNQQRGDDVQLVLGGAARPDLIEFRSG